MGLQFKLMKINSMFQHLDKEKVMNDYSNAKLALILLDFEGTLPQSTFYEKYEKKGSEPHEKVLEVLDQLTKDPKNIVFIITGREKELVEKWFDCKFN